MYERIFFSIDCTVPYSSQTQPMYVWRKVVRYNGENEPTSSYLSWGFVRRARNIRLLETYIPAFTMMTENHNRFIVLDLTRKSKFPSSERCSSAISPSPWSVPALSELVMRSENSYHHNAPSPEKEKGTSTPHPQQSYVNFFWSDLSFIYIHPPNWEEVRFL